jgi:hypothetical protein
MTIPAQEMPNSWKVFLARSQARNARAVSYSHRQPNESRFAGVADNGHQEGLFVSIYVQKLREIGVNYLKQADFVHLGHPIGQLTGLQDRLVDAAGLAPTRATQDAQVPQSQQWITCAPTFIT